MSSVLETAGRAVFRLGFEISPIILTNGVATGLPGQMLPIISITEAANFGLNILQSGASQTQNLDNFFAHFKPAPGSTLAENEIGHYPFANQTVAANAVIAHPLRVSLIMICPVKIENGYAAKLLTLTTLKNTLAQHDSSGGTYTVATPSYIYTNCLLLRMRDISNSGSNQSQIMWQFDFEQPLISLSEAQQAQNSLMNKLANGLKTDGSLSGPAATAGNPYAAPGVAPGAKNLAGSSVGGYLPQIGGLY